MALIMSDIFINFISFFSLINYAAFSKHDHWPPKSNVINIAFLFLFNFSYQWYLNWSSFCHAPLLMNVFRSCLFSDDNMHEAREELMAKVVELLSLEPITSTSIRLTWKLLTKINYLHGFYIRCDYKIF